MNTPDAFAPLIDREGAAILARLSRYDTDTAARIIAWVLEHQNDRGERSIRSVPSAPL